MFSVFLFNCAKSLLVELWANKTMQKVDRGGGGASIYERINICIYILTLSENRALTFFSIVGSLLVPICVACKYIPPNYYYIRYHLPTLSVSILLITYRRHIIL